MEASSIDTYGGARTNRVDVEVPETDIDADDLNALLEHNAQMTRTSLKAWVEFECTATAAPTTVTPSLWSTQWGRGVAQRPTVSKTDTGIYVVTFATTYDDALGNTETLAFKECMAQAWTEDDDDEVFARRRALTANTVTVCVQEFNAGSFARADVATGSSLAITVSVRIYG